jgi:hypothetical protein
MIAVNRLAEAGILTRGQVAKDLDITEETLGRWELQDGFPGRTVGRTTLYDVEAIRTWINAKGE